MMGNEKVFCEQEQREIRDFPNIFCMNCKGRFECADRTGKPNKRAGAG